MHLPSRMTPAYMLATISRSLHPPTFRILRRINTSFSAATLSLYTMTLLIRIRQCCSLFDTLTLLLPWPGERDDVNFTTTVVRTFSHSIAFPPTFETVISNTPFRECTGLRTDHSGPGSSLS